MQVFIQFYVSKSSIVFSNEFVLKARGHFGRTVVLSLQRQRRVLFLRSCSPYNFLVYSILEFLRRIIAFLIRGAPGWLVGATLGGKDSEVNTSNVNIVNCITLAKVKISTQLNIISDKKDCMRR